MHDRERVLRLLQHSWDNGHGACRHLLLLFYYVFVALVKYGFNVVVVERVVDDASVFAVLDYTCLLPGRAVDGKLPTGSY